MRAAPYGIIEKTRVFSCPAISLTIMRWIMRYSSALKSASRSVLLAGMVFGAAAIVHAQDSASDRGGRSSSEKGNYSYGKDQASDYSKAQAGSYTYGKDAAKDYEYSKSTGSGSYTYGKDAAKDHDYSKSKGSGSTGRATGMGSSSSQGSSTSGTSSGSGGF